jgi:hypothetical protein
MGWQGFKEFVAVWYLRIAAFYLMQNLLLYVAACILAGKVVGVTGYVGFIYHCCRWL